MHLIIYVIESKPKYTNELCSLKMGAQSKPSPNYGSIKIHFIKQPTESIYKMVPRQAKNIKIAKSFGPSFGLRRLTWVDTFRKCIKPVFYTARLKYESRRNRQIS